MIHFSRISTMPILDCHHMIFLFQNPRRALGKFKIRTFLERCLNSFRTLFELFSNSFRTVFELFSNSFWTLFELFSNSFRTLLKSRIRLFEILNLTTTCVQNLRTFLRYMSTQKKPFIFITILALSIPSSDLIYKFHCTKYSCY